MNVVKTVCLSLLILLLSFTLQAEAKTYAYLIGTDGKATKIDADTDTITATQDLPNAGGYIQSGKTSVVADKINNNLFVVTGRLTPSIYVYDLQTLSFKKDLGIKSGNPDVGMLISPDGKQLFINWFKEGGWFFDLYNAKNLSKVKNLGKFVWGPITTFSSDGSKIYVYDEENDVFQVNEMTNFTLLDTIGLNTIWKTNGFVSGIEDYKNERILIRETKKRLLSVSRQRLHILCMTFKARPHPLVSQPVSQAVPAFLLMGLKYSSMMRSRLKMRGVLFGIIRAQVDFIFSMLQQQKKWERFNSQSTSRVRF